ncbi:MAG: hypothetical protein ACLPOO_10960 [Terriglobales bacterium]
MQPITHTVQFRHRQKQQTEASVLRKLDDLIEMLDTPELQTDTLRTALAASRGVAAVERDADASESKDGSLHRNWSQEAHETDKVGKQ